MTPRQLRVSRAAAASAVATFVAAVSHTIGGGALPHPLLILAVSVFLVPLAALLVGGRPSLVRIALTVGVSQVAFHVLFHMLGAGAASSSFVGHQHHGGTADLTAAASSLAGPGVGMLAAHTMAAFLTTLLIWRGEILLVRIASWVQALLLRARIAVAIPTSAPVFPRTSPRVFRARVLSGPVLRRGPPLLSGG